MPDPFGNKEASPDTQVIICVVDCINTPPFAKPVGQWPATLQWFV